MRGKVRSDEGLAAALVALPVGGAPLVRLIPGLPYRAGEVWLKLESGNPTPCPSPAGFEDLGVAWRRWGRR